ncbi:putative membrane protein YccC [Mycolicibacterium senegalense]|nr:putative membrane protein YccC [Mycolicibacterium senegalense]
MHTGGQAADALRLGTPDAGAVLRSLIGVLAVTAVAMAWGSGATAMWTLSGGVIAGAIALQRSPGGRIPLVVTGSVELAIAVLLGTLAGGHSPTFVAVVALWCFAAGMQWSLGANAGLVASAASALLVLAPPVAPTVGQVILAPFLVVLAGVVQAVLIAVWPPRRWRAQREGLTRAYRSLAADSRNVAANSAADVDDAPLTWLREVFADSQVSQRPRAYHGGYRLPERLAGTLASLHATAERGDTDDESAADNGLPQLLTAAAVLLDAIADHGHTARRDAEHALVRVHTAAAAVTGPEAALAQRFCEQLREAAVLRFGQLHRPDLIGSLASAPAVVRSHLTWTSPILRHAIRLSVTTALAVAAARYGGLEHGYWMPLAVVVVLRPETAHTYTRCAGRIAGLCVGIVVACLLTFIWQPGPVGSAVCALLFVGLAYGVAQFGYLAVGAAVGAIVMFAIGVGAAAPWSGNADRLFAVLIGGALAVMAHVALPDHDLIRLRQRAGELLMTEIDYAALVIKAFVHEIDHPAEILSAAWQRAFRARGLRGRVGGGQSGPAGPAAVVTVLPHRAQLGDQCLHHAGEQPPDAPFLGTAQRVHRRGRRLRGGAARSTAEPGRAVEPRHRRTVHRAASRAQRGLDAVRRQRCGPHPDRRVDHDHPQPRGHRDRPGGAHSRVTLAAGPLRQDENPLGLGGDALGI